MVAREERQSFVAESDGVLDQLESAEGTFR